jgi:hypothetical protein
MPLDQKGYRAEYLRTRNAKQALPDDLLERYAIDLDDADAEIAAQVKAVRAYWNAFKPGQKFADVVRLCRIADEALKAEHGERMLQKSWWLEYADQRKQSAAESVGKIAERLKSAHGQLGVVTQASLDSSAAAYGVSPQQMTDAAREAGLTVVQPRPLPAPPIKGSQFTALELNLNACGALTIPELLHPGSGEFRILDGYRCVGDSGLRLDLAAVVTAFSEVEKLGKSAANDARREALQFLKTAVAKGVDLTELTETHLADLGRDSIGRGASATLDLFVDLKVERADAATFVAVLAEREVAAAASGIAKVDSLLDDGRLGEAEAAAAAIPERSEERKNALKKVADARARLDRLRSEVQTTVRAGEELRADSLVKEMARISGEDAEATLAAVPLAPVDGLRLVADGDTVKLYWRPSEGHGEETTYVVARGEERPPPSPADGREVTRTTEVLATDSHAPVAAQVHYSVFATAPHRPGSRPTGAAITIVPPVANITAEVGPDEVTVRWSSHPACVGVEVQRAEPGTRREPVESGPSSCRLTGLPEGVPIHFEIVAVYRDPRGNLHRSEAKHVDATPRSAAKPLPKLRARPVDNGGKVLVRVSWTPIDSSEVRILASASPPPWGPGTWISQEQLARFGEFGSELVGRRTTRGKDEVLEVTLDSGIHHLFAVSVGGTGIVCGASKTVGVTAPIGKPAVTAFGTYATISWEWPEGSEVAEVRTEVDGEVEIFELTRADYQADGGARVRLGATACKVEVRAMIHSREGAFASPPVAILVDERNEAEISYRVSSSVLNKRSKTVTFTSESGCAGAAIRVVAAAGSVMPVSAEEQFVLLDERLDLDPGKPAAYPVTVPKSISKPRWVRCFSMDGKARLIDPPISDLKD